MKREIPFRLSHGHGGEAGLLQVWVCPAGLWTLAGSAPKSPGCSLVLNHKQRFWSLFSETLKASRLQSNSDRDPCWPEEVIAAPEERLCSHVRTVLLWRTQ